MAEAGFEGKLYIGTAGGGQTANTEVKYATDVTINMSVDEIDVSSRDSAPWKDSIPGMGGWSIDFTLVYENADAATDALETAFLGRDTISVRVIDRDGDGYYGDCYVTRFDRGEPLGGAMTRNVTLRGRGAPTVINTAS
jgi:TP901-1 family phage major tail protein